MKTRTNLLLCSFGLALAIVSNSFATGPYPSTDWPPTIDSAKRVHYMVVDAAPFTVPNENWTNTISICNLNTTSADQATVTTCAKGYTGAKGNTTSYFNVADTNYFEWATNDVIDVLLQVYGDQWVLNPTNHLMARKVRFQEGTTGTAGGTYTTPSVQSYSTNAFNNKWNWVLFSMTNNWYTNGGIGYRQVGTIKAGASGDFSKGGINGGTLRMQCSDNAQGLLNFTIHAIAVGQKGAFGTTNDMNQFEAADPVTCPDVPPVNLVSLDLNAGVSNSLEVLNDRDQMSQLVTTGPADDQRTAVQSLYPTAGGNYLLNFGILSNYLGMPCNPNTAMKVCVDFYDDPLFANNGVVFGPEAYAGDEQACTVQIYPAASRHTCLGTGQWIRKSWTISSVNLHGINTSPDTGCARFTSSILPVSVSRISIAALRTDGPLAGQDPLADCLQDPLVCQGVYTNYVELDLANGITNNLVVGTSQSDQYMVVEPAGPANDQRLSVRPAFGTNGPGVYLQFAIVTSALGPSSRGNVHLSMAVTYYDDPALAGKGFRPEVWKYESLGAVSLRHMDVSQNMVLQGTGKWRDAYWEIGSLWLDGLNQLPQAAARFQCDDQIHVCRVRYAVLPPCGPNTGQNLLGSYTVLSLAAAADTNAGLQLNWPYQAPQFFLQSIPTLGAAWANFPSTPGAEGEKSVLRLAPTNSSRFFRLKLTPP